MTGTGDVAAPPVLAAREVSKRFFENTVLRRVSIEIRPGRVHALLGENGAGKSTLINLLSGVLQPDEGAILVDGQARRGLSPAEARRLGVAVVQQELSLAPHLSVAENIAMGAMPKRGGFIDYTRLAAETERLCARLGLDVPVDLPVEALPLGRRQLVEIAKALWSKPRVLILDEPTSSLTGHEVATLFGLVRELQNDGVAVLYISHRLNEVLELCQWVTVLKDGVVTADQSLAGSDPKALVRLMVGREPGDLFPHERVAAAGATALRARGLVAEGIAGVDLEARYGEVLGLGGLLGQGQEEALRALYGDLPLQAGELVVDGAARTPRTPGEAAAAGIAYVPADRKREALLLPLPIRFNLVLPALRRLAGNGLRKLAAESTTATGLVADFAIKIADVRDAAQVLSGGNQQKIAIGRWMPLAPRIFLLNDPTRGVDVETKREIYARLRRMAADGAAILLLSSDTLELVHVCDRVVVFRGGRVAAEIARDDLSEESIVGASLGMAA
ncbi:MAG: sugar ABC transporter ATP-binding protein [Geminicoccaceae bacterium]